MSTDQPTGSTFHLGDILSITTGYLVSPDHMDGVHRLLDFMTGESLFTHQLPRASDACKPALLAQFPELSTVEVPDAFTGREHVEEWLAQQVARLGGEVYLRVQPLAGGTFEHKNALVELAEMAPGTPVLVVAVGDES